MIIFHFEHSLDLSISHRSIILQFQIFSKPYSALNASTGFFFAAILAGTNPAINVNNMLPNTRRIAYKMFRLAIPEISNKDLMNILIGMQSRYETPMPNTPAVNPIITASALNTLDISFFLAPTLLKIP